MAGFTICKKKQEPGRKGPGSRGAALHFFLLPQIFMAEGAVRLFKTPPFRSVPLP